MSDQDPAEEREERAEGSSDQGTEEPKSTGADTESTAGAGDSSSDDGTDWRASSRRHERESKRERSRAEKAEAELQKYREAAQSDQEKAVNAAREEGAQSVRSEYEERLIRSEMRTHLSGKLDSEIARLAARDISIEELKSDDTRAIQARVDEYLEEHPSLTERPKAKGSANGGVDDNEEAALDDLPMDDFLKATGQGPYAKT